MELAKAGYSTIYNKCKIKHDIPTKIFIRVVQSRQTQYSIVAFIMLFLGSIRMDCAISELYIYRGTVFQRNYIMIIFMFIFL